jgi:hypothetical protein
METLDARRLQQAVSALQTRVRILQTLFVLSLLTGAGYSAVRQDAAVADPPAPGEDRILRARGLIIEDDKGRPRILLGAPVPVVDGRRRRDPATALIFVGENGADRAIFGLPPNPQVKGRVIPRIAASAGMTLHDPDGNERGGFSWLDNGRVVLGLDFKDHEGIGLIVNDAEGYAAVLLNSESGGVERAGLYAGRDGTSVVKVDGSPNGGGLVLKSGSTGPAELLRVEPKTQKMTDVLKGLK